MPSRRPPPMGCAGTSGCWTPARSSSPGSSGWGSSGTSCASATSGRPRSSRQPCSEAGPHLRAAGAARSTEASGTSVSRTTEAAAHATASEDITRHAGRAQRPAARSERLDVDRLGPLVASLGVVADLCALGERPIPLADDAGVMHEEVLLTVVGADEAEPLVVAEPLHGAGGHTEFSSDGVLHTPRML